MMQEWGWVMEMYGFTISCFLSGVGAADLHLRMMAQPPWDKVQVWMPWAAEIK